MELPFAGETALAKQSMLNYPKHMVYAMDKKLGKGMVDIVSLVQSLKEVEDERVEMQIEEIMEEYRW